MTSRKNRHRLSRERAVIFHHRVRRRRHRSNSSAPAGVTVSLTGLVNNPTYGSSARIGEPLGVAATGGTVTAYQWTTQAGGDIGGATSATFTPDSSYDGANIYCKVTIDGLVYNTVAATVRYAAPVAANGVADQT